MYNGQFIASFCFYYSFTFLILENTNKNLKTITYCQISKLFFAILVRNTVCLICLDIHVQKVTSTGESRTKYVGSKLFSCYISRRVAPSSRLSQTPKTKNNFTQLCMVYSLACLGYSFSKMPFGEMLLQGPHKSSHRNHC